MNNENNLLDNLIHNSVEDAQFAFKEEYWDKMEAMLDEDEKDKKRPFFWRWFSVIVAVLVVGGGTLLYSKLNSKNEIPKEEIPNSKVEVSKEEISESNVGNPNNEIPTSKEEQPINTVQKSYESDEVESVNKNQSTSNQKTESEIVSNKKIDVDNEKIIISSPKKSIHKPTKKTIDENFEAISTDNKKLDNSSRKVNSNKLKTKNSKLTTTVADNRHLTSDISSFTDNRQLTTDNIIINGKPMVQTSVETFTQKEMIDQSKYNPRYNAALKDYVPEKYDSIVILTFKPVKEETATASKPTEKPKVKEPFEPQPFNLFMLAGANMNKGFTGNVTNAVKWGFAPYVGAGFEKPIANKITISSHVGFTYFNGLNLQKTVSGNNYSFGLDSSSISVYHKKMFQLYLPISMYYQLFKNHYLMGGLGASYAMNVSSTYEEIKGTSSGYNITSAKPNTNFTTTSTPNQMGYSKGFNQFDIFLQAGYNYQIFRNLMIQIGVQQGLMDMTKNTYFNNNTKNSQTRFSLGIKYSFKRNND